MRKMLRMMVYSPLALAALAVTGIFGGGFSPASYLSIYQPTPPVK